MDYEKAYKEALERAKEKHDEYIRLDNDNVVPKDIEYIFPELAESEDEKIRKELIEFVETNTISTDERQARWIAWLEKQEWSEYDKIQLSEAIQMIEANGTWTRSEDAVKKISNWLKSLKPNHWKPSEYDISLLEEIARNIRNNVRPFCSEVSSLEVLIDTLKNL